MKKIILFLLLALSYSTYSLALVNPDESDEAIPAWYAEIFVEDPATQELQLFCKGSLIDPQWILLAETCVFDPFKVLLVDAMPSGSELFVRLGGEGLLIRGEVYVPSNDFSIGMLKLTETSDKNVLALSDLTTEELYDKKVKVISNHSTRETGNSVYNSNSDQEMSCTVDELEFYSDAAICYILSIRQESSTVLSSEFYVTNPLEYFSGSALIDLLFSDYDHAGPDMKLRNSNAKSYPCLEDIGAPLLVEDADGAYTQVGVVTGVGMVVGSPLCNGFVLDDYSNMAFYKEFVESTKAQYAFDQQCPETPKPEFEVLSHNKVRIFWDSVVNGTGYKLHYTEREGYVPIETSDLGNAIEYVSTIKQDYLYSFAVSAYSKKCTSRISAKVSVLLPAAL